MNRPNRLAASFKLPELTYRVRKVWRRNFDVFMKTYKVNFFPPLLEPIFYLLAMGLGLGGFVSATQLGYSSYIKFIAPALVAISIMYSSFFECTYGSFVRMYYQKTFDAILATPITIDDLIAGELMWGSTKSLVYGTIIIIVISLFGLVASPLVIGVIPILFVSGLIFSEISLIFVAKVPGIDSFNYFYTLLMTPMFLFSGIFFPVNALPPVIAKIAYFTPLYHLVNVCRSFAAGRFSAAGGDIAWLLVVAALLSVYPFRLMRKRIIK